MAVFDLKTALLLLTLAVMAAVGLAMWLARRGTSRPAAGGEGQAVEETFAAAPFGLLVLEGTQVVRANAEAQRLLRLPTPPIALPDAEWLPLLLEDCAAARADAASGRYRTVTFASGQTTRWWTAPWSARDLVFVFDVTPQQRAE
ncbi:MAG TPA: hypothetical protein PLQ85_13615, partial [Anaerolineae bacterium]|nr:hypothetical protein [Anaerolineae bacterium]